MNIPESRTTEVAPIHVTVKDAARILGISPHHCYRLLNAEPPAIDSRYIGKRRLVVLASLRAYAESLPVKPEAAEESA